MSGLCFFSLGCSLFRGEKVRIMKGIEPVSPAVLVPILTVGVSPGES